MPALALLLAAVLSACGGSGSPSAASLMRDTFSSSRPIESGRVDLSFDVSPIGPSGSHGAAQPLALRVQGPFQSLGPSRLPRFALSLTLRSGGHTLQAGATSTAGQLFVELAGAYFAAPASTVKSLQQSYAQATRTSSSAASQSTFASLGLDPGEWLEHPRVAGSAEIAGEPTTHITGRLDVNRFLTDAEKLSGADGALGLGASPGGLSIISPEGIKALTGSVHSARMDVYTGTSDQQLRRLSVTANIAAAPQARDPLGALGSARLQLILQFAALDRPQAIAAPSNPQPISKLLPALERLGLELGAGATS